MKSQSYQNHTRFYPPHHFVFYPLLMILLGFALYFVYAHESLRMVWCFIAVLLCLVGWLSFMLRQHYALNNQNRLVRMEMRFRYYVLTGQRLELLEPELSFGQIAALRFAGDQELPALVKRALAEHLAPDDIKQAITDWQADHMRV